MARVISVRQVEATWMSMVDEDAEGDIAFLLYAIATYCAVRIATELLMPGIFKGYTYQQYIVTLVQQTLLLPQ